MKFSSTSISKHAASTICVALLATQSFGALADADNEVPNSNDVKI